ncbi:MAG TPA: iron ABC transporter permease [Myxococcota bacterium]|nr:iron ABC transporter permease [Myxococcota bacterium]
MKIPRPLMLLAMFVLLMGAMVLSILYGASSIDVFAILSGASNDAADQAILFRERLPRTILGASVGASLAAAGLAFQAILKNPLADPYVIGVAGGSAIGGTLAMTLPIAAVAGQAGVSILAFVFGLVAIAGTWWLSKDSRGRINVWEVLLVGVIFNTFASAVIMFMKSVVRAQKAQEMLMWLMGTLSSDVRGPVAVSMSVGMTIVGSIILFRQAPALNALAVGEEDAASVGVDTASTTRTVLVAGSLLVASAVSVAGMIGFVGLIVPHGVRVLVGSDHRFAIPASILSGASFLVLADVATRILFPVFETEAPVGVMTAIIGGPVFVWLLRRGSR